MYTTEPEPSSKLLIWGVNVPLSLDRMSRCKLVLDDDRIIELNVEDYLNHENITTETDMSGYSTITLNNIKDIKIK